MKEYMETMSVMDAIKASHTDTRTFTIKKEGNRNAGTV